jgi:hypothetical protein
MSPSAFAQHPPILADAAHARAALRAELDCPEATVILICIGNPSGSLPPRTVRLTRQALAQLCEEPRGAVVAEQAKLI